MFKKIIAVGLIVSMLTGCGEPLTITNKDGEKTYPTYGLFNQDTDKSKDVCYKISVGNVVWSIIGFQNIVMPVYFVGFSLFNPIRLKRDDKDDCSFQ